MLTRPKTVVRKKTKTKKMNNIIVLLQENKLSLYNNLDFLFGYDFNPEVKGNSYANPKVTYEFILWNKEDKCNTT